MSKHHEIHLGSKLDLDLSIGKRPEDRCTLHIYPEIRHIHAVWRGFLSNIHAAEATQTLYQKFKEFKIRTYLSDCRGMLGEPFQERFHTPEHMRGVLEVESLRIFAYVRPENFLTALGQEKFVRYLNQLGIRAEIFTTGREAERWLFANSTHLLPEDQRTAAGTGS